MADVTNLQAAAQAVIDNVAKMKTAVESTVTFIDGIGGIVTAAVTDALQKDNAADQGSIDAATAAITESLKPLSDSADALVAAVNANTPPAPTPDPAPAG